VTDPCAQQQGTPVPNFTYEPLVGHGVVNGSSVRFEKTSATGTATNFTVDPAKTYYVNVYDDFDRPLACGVLGQ
jgi:hypothetical protein